MCKAGLSRTTTKSTKKNKEAKENVMVIRDNASSPPLLISFFKFPTEGAQ